MPNFDNIHLDGEVDPSLLVDRSFQVEWFEHREADENDNFGNHAESPYTLRLSALEEPPLDLEGFCAAVEDVVQRVLESEGVPEDRRWIVVPDFPGTDLGDLIENRGIVITFKMRKRESARLTGGASRGVGRKLEVATVDVPETPNHRIGVHMEFIDHEVELTLWSTSNSLLIKNGPKFEAMLKNNVSYFYSLGAMRLRWLRSSHDQILNVAQQRLVGYKTVFSVRLAEMELKSTPKIRYVKVIAGVALE